MIKFVSPTIEPIGKTEIIKLTEKGDPYIANCRLVNSFAKYEGKYAKIESVQPNNGRDSSSFPYYAKIKIVNND